MTFLWLHITFGLSQICKQMMQSLIMTLKVFLPLVRVLDDMLYVSVVCDLALTCLFLPCPCQNVVNIWPTIWTIFQAVGHHPLKGLWSLFYPHW